MMVLCRFAIYDTIEPVALTLILSVSIILRFIPFTHTTNITYFLLYPPRFYTHTTPLPSVTSPSPVMISATNVKTIHTHTHTFMYVTIKQIIGLSTR